MARTSRRKRTLLVDAGINLLLGILLLAYSPGLANLLGVPMSDSGFYPNILGAIFVGISVALLVEVARPPMSDFTGLGLVGAVSINLCGGLALALWLIAGHLDLPLRGQVLLWSLVAVLVVLSSVEFLWAARRERRP